MSGPWCAAMRRMRTGQAIVRTEGTSCVRERRRVRLSSLLCLSDSPAERRTAVYSCRPVGDVRKKTDARPSHQRSRHREGRVEPRGRAHRSRPATDPTVSYWWDDRTTRPAQSLPGSDPNPTAGYKGGIRLHDHFTTQLQHSDPHAPRTTRPAVPQSVTHPTRRGLSTRPSVPITLATPLPVARARSPAAPCPILPRSSCRTRRGQPSAESARPSARPRSLGIHAARP